MADAPLIMVCANQAWNLVNFRAALITHFIERGYRVLAVAPHDPIWTARLQDMGCTFAPLPMQPSGQSPLSDMQTFLAILRLLRAHKPYAWLSWTIKPNIYGSLAARIAGVRAVPNVSGLGTVFIKRTMLTKIAMALYRLCFNRCTTVFFQNDDDRDLFVSRKLVRYDQTKILPGSGVDCDHFKPIAEDRPQPGQFLMIARLLADKGVREYVQAARALKAEFKDARFVLMGPGQVDNPTAIGEEELAQWIAEGTIEYMPPVDDVRPEMERSDWIVLPSYREGRSKVLLEAAAMGRPAITSDAPGCRDVVIDGKTGFLAKPADSVSLTLALRLAMMTDDQSWQRMARAARHRAETEFAPAIVIRLYREALGMS